MLGNLFLAQDGWLSFQFLTHSFRSVLRPIWPWEHEAARGGSHLAVVAGLPAPSSASAGLPVGLEEGGPERVLSARAGLHRPLRRLFLPKQVTRASLAGRFICSAHIWERTPHGQV